MSKNQIYNEPTFSVELPTLPNTTKVKKEKSATNNSNLVIQNFPNMYIFEGKLSKGRENKVDKSLVLTHEAGRHNTENHELKTLFESCNSEKTQVIFVSVETHQKIIEELKSKYSGGEPLCVFNLCDGTEVDGYPGISVVSYLEKSTIPYTGADPLFYECTTSKPYLKTKLIAANVPTSQFFEIRKGHEREDFEVAVSALGFPVIIKPAVSYASLSISKKSLIHRRSEEAIDQVKETLTKNPEGVFVEQFLPGREFTVLVTGDKDIGLEIYTPAERVFNKNLEKFEKFLSFDQYWKYELEGKVPEYSADDFYWYEAAPIEWQMELKEIARNAYNACGGNGYGRVDIRTKSLDKLDAFVLEVNANCGIYGSCTTTEILKISKVTSEEFFTKVVNYSCKRNAIKLQSL
ncbi:hypothetical protein HDU92_000559 [Lobulomyces angularis]|nr:hypothetical protein HDU92_000559 [Lobulomyces angularis]